MYKKLLVLFLIGYVASYFLLSIFGRYEDNYSAIEKIIGPCLCLSSTLQWQPAYIVLAQGDSSEEVYANFLGKSYYPLVRADQKFWHPNEAIVRRPYTPEEIEKQAKNLREHGHI